MNFLRPHPRSMYSAWFRTRWWRKAGFLVFVTAILVAFGIGVIMGDGGGWVLWTITTIDLAIVLGYLYVPVEPRRAQRAGR